MKKQISGKYSHLFLTIDDSDGHLFEKRKFYGIKSGNYIHFRSYNGNKRSDGFVRPHELILGKVSGMVVDHIDGNTLNNSKSNLRFVTPQENAQNRRKSSNKKSSKYIGVDFVCDSIAKNNKWRARIGLNKKSFCIGYFKTEQEAAIAYNNYIIENSIKYKKLNDFK